MTKGLLTLLFLDFIDSAAVTFTELSIIMTPHYGRSPIKNISRRLNYQYNNPKSVLYKIRSYIANKKVFYNLIYRLRSDNLVIEKDGVLELTSAGRELKNKLSEKESNPSLSNFKKEIGKELIILTFDIPEKYKKRRDWLRVVLVRLGFSRLQKSVWIGKVKLSKEFVKVLHELDLVPYIEILAVTRSGSIKHLV
jgi:virulence-associated protein VapD